MAATPKSKPKPKPKPKPNWINDQVDRNWREFSDGEVATNDKEWRSAKIASLFDNVESLFLPKLKELMPTACEKLNLSHKMGRIEKIKII